MHDATFADVARIRELTGCYTPPAGVSHAWQEALRMLAAFEEDLRTHVWLENDVLFSKARALANAAPAS